MEQNEFLKLLNRAKTSRRSPVTAKPRTTKNWELSRRTVGGALSIFALLPSSEWTGWKDKDGNRFNAVVMLEPGDILAVYTLTHEQAETWRHHRKKPDLIKWRAVNSSRSTELHIPCELFPADMGNDLSLELVAIDAQVLRFKVSGAADDNAGAKSTVNTGIGHK